MILDLLNKSRNEKNKNNENDLVKVTALLIHAAKIDDNYSNKEKSIIIDFVKSVENKVNAEKIINEAEIEEKNSNQILKYTQEIKKNSLEFKKEIIKILWKIILSDGKSDMYENTLMRRIAGLLYIPDKLIGEIKTEVLNKK